MWSCMGDALKITVFSLIPIFFTIAISSVAVAAALIAMLLSGHQQQKKNLILAVTLRISGLQLNLGQFKLKL